MFRIEHNAETGEIVKVELTAEEIQELEALYKKTVEDNKVKELELQKTLEAKKIAQTKLQALGLDNDDLKALGLQIANEL